MQMDYTKQQRKNGKKGGKQTLKLHGTKHFVKAAKKRWVNK